MRKRWLLLVSVISIVALGACGPVAVDEGAGGGSITPTPTPGGSGTPTPAPATQPSFATFNSAIEPILVAQACGGAGCHAAPGGGGVDLVTTGPTPAQVQANYDQLACNGPLDTFTPPAGTLLDRFCTGTTALATAAQHSTRTLTNADCAALVNWVQTGTAGSLPQCL